MYVRRTGGLTQWAGGLIDWLLSACAPITCGRALIPGRTKKGTTEASSERGTARLCLRLAGLVLHAKALNARDSRRSQATGSVCVLKSVRIG